MRRALKISHAFGAAAALLLGACAQQTPAPVDPLMQSMDQHREVFGSFELPRKIGSVLNVGSQLPAISPDGRQLLYLRREAESLQRASSDDGETAGQGPLSLWLRPADGMALGRRISQERWAHSAVWSPSGQYIAYVGAKGNGAAIVRFNVETGQRDVLGDGDAFHCLPQFDGDDARLLFCRGESETGPYRVCRQTVGEAQPTSLTPDGMSCSLPVLSVENGVVCARADGEHMGWVECTPEHMADLAPGFGPSQSSELGNTWAGINVPVSPDRKSFIYYSGNHNRVAVCHLADKVVRQHRPGSIAACWLTNEAIALATAEGLFAVNTATGVSATLLSGGWVPMRYVPASSKLYLLGKEDGPSTLAVYELIFRPNTAGSAGRSG